MNWGRGVSLVHDPWFRSISGAPGSGRDQNRSLGAM